MIVVKTSLLAARYRIATERVSPLPSPKSKNPKYPTNTHASVNIPNLASPRTARRCGMAIKAETKGIAVPKALHQIPRYIAVTMGFSEISMAWSDCRMLCSAILDYGSIRSSYLIEVIFSMQLVKILFRMNKYF